MARTRRDPEPSAVPGSPTAPAGAPAVAAPPPVAGLLPGLALTLWHGDGLLPALEGAKGLLAQAHPPIVQMHAGPRSLASAGPRVAAALCDMIPGVRLWAGIPCDGWYRGYVQHSATERDVVQRLVEAAAAAVDLGCEAVVWNAESEWKNRPLEGNRIAAEVVATVAEKFPALVQGHTSFDHPTYHATFPWSGWIGPNSKVTLALPQVYAAPGNDTTAGVGALASREKNAKASWAVAVSKGWIAPDPPLVWMPYLQGHHVPTRDTVRCALAYPLVAVWAAPSRLDEAGARAVRVVCELRRRGFYGPTAVQDFNRAEGLPLDTDAAGVCGPKVLAALGVE